MEPKTFYSSSASHVSHTVEAEKAKLRASINISTKFHNSPQGEKLASIKRSNRFLNRTKSRQQKTVLGRRFYDWFSFSLVRWWVNNSTSSSLIELAIGELENSRSQLLQNPTIGIRVFIGYGVNQTYYANLSAVKLLRRKPWTRGAITVGSELFKELMKSSTTKQIAVSVAGMATHGKVHRNSLINLALEMFS